jgi:hypothetical protein
MTTIRSNFLAVPGIELGPHACSVRAVSLEKHLQSMMRILLRIQKCMIWGWKSFGYLLLPSFPLMPPLIIMMVALLGCWEGLGKDVSITRRHCLSLPSMLLGGIKRPVSNLTLGKPDGIPTLLHHPGTQGDLSYWSGDRDSQNQEQPAVPCAFLNWNRTYAEGTQDCTSKKQAMRQVSGTGEEL